MICRAFVTGVVWAAAGRCVQCEQVVGGIAFSGISVINPEPAPVPSGTEVLEAAEDAEET